MAAHRYWRLFCTANGGNASFFDIQEVELRTSIGGADQTGSGTASASSQSGGFEADKAFDNNSGTTWFTPASNLPAWLKYDFGLGNDKDIVEVAVTAWAFQEQVSSFLLQFSDDASTWTTLYDIQNQLNWPSGEQRVFHANTGPTTGGANTFWRVKATAVDGSTVFGLAEVQMFTATGGPTNQCTGGTGWASTQQEIDGPPSEAFDSILTPSGAFGDYWSASFVTNEWIGYQFAAAKTVTVVGISARDASGFQNQAPKDFIVQRWDGAAYQDVMTLTGITGWTSGQTRYFSAAGEVAGPPATASSARPVVFICT